MLRALRTKADDAASLSIGKFLFFNKGGFPSAAAFLLESSSSFGFLPKGSLGRFPNNLLLSKALLSGRSKRLNFLNTIFGLPELLLVVLGAVLGAGVLASLLLGMKRFLGLFDGVNLGVSFSEFCSRIDSLTLSLKELDRPLLKLDLDSSSTLDLPREILLFRLSPSLEERSILSPSSSSLST